ncbi:MAG TPA: hypothetical protein VIM16_07485 [Mucilaginibacter sp.]|jgi:ppGpp synthetase/RelA/SpoT-type nucleotidyltranferase
MNYQTSDYQRICRTTLGIIEEDLIKTGIFYRIYFRVKSSKSLSKKLESENSDGTAKYNEEAKLIRDLLGFRINLYFVDDLEILLNHFKNKYAANFLEEAIDIQTSTEFKPTRVNLIFRLPSEAMTEFNSINRDKRVDSTFELQLRTIFSEGWHEVDHDFRYKSPDDWLSYNSLSRTFNGILAALETHEWSIIKLLEELSYSHYKTGNYSAMIRMQLRIRTENVHLTETLTDAIKRESSFIKSFYKIERNTVINFLLTHDVAIPFTVDNLIYLINYFFIKNKKVLSLTPSILLKQFQEIKKKPAPASVLACGPLTGSKAIVRPI